MSVSIINIKLGRPYNMPEKRFTKLLAQCRRYCCLARNAVVMHWYAWRREHPDWKPGDAYESRPTKIIRTPKANAKPPKDGAVGPKLFMERTLYDVACATVPLLNAGLAGSCARDVINRLRSNVPYDHERREDGTKTRFVWDAILRSEVSVPTWRRGRIPVLKGNLMKDGKVVKLHYDDDSCWLELPLLSRKSGCRILSPRVRLHVSDLSAGNRRLLRKVIAGDWPICDSQIVETKGKWYLQLCYTLPGSEKSLRDRVLTLQPGKPDSAYPFRLTWIDDDGAVRDLAFGRTRALVAEYRRIVDRRRELRLRYSRFRSAVISLDNEVEHHGHGKARFYAKLKPMERSVVDACGRWQKQFISDVCKIAAVNGCGKILYREPTMPLRSHSKSFFVREDVPFDWTQFGMRLKSSCDRPNRSLELEIKRIGTREWNPKEPVNEEAVSA